MIGIIIDLSGGEALERSLETIANQVQRPAALLKAVGHRGVNELKAHFRSRDTIPNKLGGRRTRFWRQVEKQTQSPVLVGDRTVTISINHPAIAQKVFGGRITPKQANWLTIPVDPEAHGRPVAVFQQETGIKLFRLRKKGGGLSNLLAGLESGKRLKVFYVLSKGVDQERDPEALPPEDKFVDALVAEASSYYQREKGKLGL